MQSLGDFIDHVRKTAHPVSLKVFGKQSKWTWSLFSYTYAQLTDPLQVEDADLPIEADFGKIYKSKCILEEQKCYSRSITPAEDGSNHFQGDILPLPLSAAGLPSASQYSMILSHSCEIGTQADKGRPPLVFMAPVFEQQEIEKDVAMISALAGKAYLNENAAKGGLGTWLENKSHKFMTFPAYAGDQIALDRFVVPLCSGVFVPRDQVLAINPRLRLTYRGLSFLQLKMVSCYLRDPEKSDESRDY